jgi:hypothetical protein
VSSAAAFARRIATRWERRIVSPRPLGLSLLQPARNGVGGVGARTTNVALRLAPRVSLTVVRPERLESVLAHVAVQTTVLRERAGSAGPAAGAAAAPPATLLRETASLTALRLTAFERAEQLVGRLQSRAARIETLHRPVLPQALPASLTLAPPSPARPATAALVVRTQRVDETRTPEERPPARLEHGPAAGAAVPELSVARLTDSVVAAIDQRLLAQAERLGRD